jgi:S-adenosylmethionine decarboxylase
VTEAVRRHSVADVRGVSFDLANDSGYLLGALSAACSKEGLTIRQHLSEQFDPQGVTVLLLLAESHASVHTFPEHGVVFLDCFSCGKGEPRKVLAEVIEKLGPGVVAHVKDVHTEDDGPVIGVR